MNHTVTGYSQFYHKFCQAVKPDYFLKNKAVTNKYILITHVLLVSF